MHTIFFFIAPSSAVGEWNHLIFWLHVIRTIYFVVQEF